MALFGLFNKKKKESLDKGLEKTKESVFKKLSRAIVGKSKVDDEVLDNLEEVLISSDVGVDTTLRIIERIEERVQRDKYVGTDELNRVLKEEIVDLLKENNSTDYDALSLPEGHGPYVIMVVGVNGVGKTTTIGKLAHKFKDAGKSVVLGAADTFRAAAVDQLVIWAERVGVPIVKQGMGADPASVAFDTLSKAKAENADVVLIDTAGIRRKSKVNEQIEKYSVLRAYMAVDRADVCVIMIDATEGFTEQDSKVAGYAHEQGKASVIAINKWDAVEKDGKTMQEFTKKLEVDFSFMSYAPFVFISALTGQRVDKLFEQIKYTYSQNIRRISTGTLNDMLGYATARVQPPSDKGKRLKLYYMTQASAKPPTFVIFCNDKELFHYSYQRYIENQIRESFGLDGTPIKIIARERGE